MYTRIWSLWDNFRASFWFVPGILMVAATITAYLMVKLDSNIDAAIVTAFPMFEMSPPAARSILSSIVGALVSSTGVVFSMTIVALSLASSQFGSRLVRTYRGRRTTHFTLGIFVSTSLYCILVLACIREVNDFIFVPTLSVGLGILLTVVCLATLIYYIHDMSYAIQASSVIEESAKDLHHAIQRLFPRNVGNSVPQHDADEAEIRNSKLKSAEELIGQPLFISNCDRVGYVQAIEDESVMGLAQAHDVVIRLRVRPGDFSHEGRELAEIFSIPNRKECSEDLKQEIGKELCSSLIVGSDRTPHQDIRYAFNELVEVAVRALSPGINDPFTAITCVDRIHAALLEMEKGNPVSPYRLDDDGNLRVIAYPVPFQLCFDQSLGVIEHYAKDSPQVLARVRKAMSAFQ